MKAFAFRENRDKTGLRETGFNSTTDLFFVPQKALKGLHKPSLTLEAAAGRMPLRSTQKYIFV